MLLTAHHTHGDVGPTDQAVVVEVAQLEACLQEAFETDVYLFFRELSLCHSIG